MRRWYQVRPGWIRRRARLQRPARTIWRRAPTDWLRADAPGSPRPRFHAEADRWVRRPGSFFPVYVNLVAGIKGVDRKLVEVARIYNLSGPEIARRVILPATMPNLFTGLRLGFSQAWLFVVVAEIFGSTQGLGFRLTDSQQLTRVDLVLVAMLGLAVLGKLSDTILLAIERRALRWRDTLGSETTS